MTARSEVMIIIVHSCCISKYVLFFLFLLPKNTLVSDQSFCFLIVNIAPRIEVRSVLKPCFQGLSNGMTIQHSFNIKKSLSLLSVEMVNVSLTLALCCTWQG